MKSSGLKFANIGPFQGGFRTRYVSMSLRIIYGCERGKTAHTSADSFSWERRRQEERLRQVEKAKVKAEAGGRGMVNSISTYVLPFKKTGRLFDGLLEVDLS